MFSKAFTLTLLLVFNFSFSAHAQTEASYQEEFVFLKTQLSALKNRRKKTVSSLKKLEEKLQKEVLSLGSSVSYLREQNETLQSKLSKFDENRSDKEMSLKKVEVIVSQMKDFVSKHENIEGKKTQEINAFVLSYLNKGKSLFSHKGFVFNEKGIKEEAELLSLGHVATYAFKNDQLIPLSSGADKKDLFLTDSRFDSKGFSKLGAVPVYLKEGGVQEKPATLGSVLNEKLKAGGAVGYIIILLGLAGVLVALIRYNLIRGYQTSSEEGLREVVKYIQMGEVETAKKVLKQQAVTPMSRFVDTLLSYRHKSDEVYESIVIEEISKVQSRVSKYGPYLIVLAAVAPLLGLLGTVTGMIGTFDMITLHGTGNPKLLSGGIKEALVTTQMGLIVAIPCILAGNYLSSKAVGIVTRFEELASTLPKVK